MTTKSGHIRAVARALNLLDAMNERQPCSLAELHHATGLPKPTVFRILATLEAEGYVRSEGALGQYRLTARIGISYRTEGRLFFLLPASAWLKESGAGTRRVFGGR